MEIIEKRKINNGYIFYYEDQSNILRTKNPGRFCVVRGSFGLELSPDDIYRMIENSWKSLTLEEKLHYSKMSEISSSRYTQEVEER